MGKSLNEIAFDLTQLHHKVHYSPALRFEGEAQAFVNRDSATVSDQEKQDLIDLSCALLNACTFTIHPKEPAVLTLPAVKDQTLMATALDRALHVVSGRKDSRVCWVHTDPNQQQRNHELAQQPSNDLSAFFSGNNNSPRYDAVQVIVTRGEAMTMFAFASARDLPLELQLSGAPSAQTEEMKLVG